MGPTLGDRRVRIDTYPGPVLQVPRSARLAAWGTAALRAQVSVQDAVRAVVDDDEPHTVDVAGHAAGLPDLLGVLATRGVRELRVVLPAPGDVLGLPGPPAFNALALEAGECVLADDDDTSSGSALGPTSGPVPSPVGETGTGIVPHLEQFGSVWEPGTLVSWTVHATLRRRVTHVGSLAEADRELRQALAEATTTLSTLDVARWRDDAAAAIADVRSGVLSRTALPPTAPPRALAVLATAARVRAIVELATQDDGAAISGWEATQRAEALRGLDAVARRGIVAAVNAALEPSD
jgi:hypothetical protein